MKPAIVIAGPTASGKSSLGLSVAQAFDGWVINADSMQVYDGMRILTARPRIEDEARLPHRLYGVLPPSDICSAARWRDLAAREMDLAWNAGAVPVLVGGTGLYLRALTEGLSPIPAIPAAIRDQARTLLSDMGNAAFHAMLHRRDPQMADRLDSGNSQRLSRAWEVIEATGKSLAEWQKQPNEGAVSARWLTLVLDPPRDALNAACDGRFRHMVETGALEEARFMATLHLADDCPAAKALGLSDLIRHLDGAIGLDEAIARASAATRAYAKRQGTWFRHQTPHAVLVKEQFSESLEDKIFPIIRQFLLTSQ